MGAVTYPDATVSSLIREHFVPVQLNLGQAGEIAHRFQVIWTPNINIIDHNERLAYHSEGWLSPADFAAMLQIGRGHFQLRHKKFDEAGKIFESLADVYPENRFAPEALYYLATCRYLASHDAGQLMSHWQRLQRRYPVSSWAMRSEV